MLVAFVAVMSSLIIILAGGAQASTMPAPAANTPTAHEAVASPTGWHQPSTVQQAANSSLVLTTNSLLNTATSV